MNSPIDSSVKITKPFSSDTDKEKQDLILNADLYRDKLETQWTGLKSDAGDYGKKALVIGGAIATSYLLMNALLPKPKKPKPVFDEYALRPVEVEVKPKKSKQFAVGKAVQSLAWTIALEWARQRLKHLVADDQKPNENSGS
ncbi:hypothetical protein [Dyadobacter sandarakinus]|uniref:Uncharacterized protein n=1 Tax=Dyadobacter sandarakinus TaxID=2747268 RepID=A0ABX7I8G3_9BACT|nr:hypothetical protein [Dyadobacter sandarakinus]QRR02396.1 hypothetical protein HWI92_16505 [Dyadobacter sandarakinus]